MRQNASPNYSDMINYLNTKNTFTTTPKSSNNPFFKPFGLNMPQSNGININTPKTMILAPKSIIDSLNVPKMDSYASIKEKNLKDTHIMQTPLSPSDINSMRNLQKMNMIQDNDKVNTSLRSSSQDPRYQTTNKPQQQQIQFQYHQQQQFNKNYDSGKENYNPDLDLNNRYKRLEINTDMIGTYSNNLNGNYKQTPTNAYKLTPNSTKNKDFEKNQENIINNIYAYTTHEFNTKFNSPKAANFVPTISTANTTENTPLYTIQNYSPYDNTQYDKKNYNPKSEVVLLNKSSTLNSNNRVLLSRVDNNIDSLTPLKKRGDDNGNIGFGQDRNLIPNYNKTVASPNTNTKINNFFGSNINSSNLSATIEAQRYDKNFSNIRLHTCDDEDSTKKPMNKTFSEIKNPMKLSATPDLKANSNKVNIGGMLQNYTYQNFGRIQNNINNNNGIDHSNEVKINHNSIKNTADKARSSSQNPTASSFSVNSTRNNTNQIMQNTKNLQLNPNYTNYPNNGGLSSHTIQLAAHENSYIQAKNLKDDQPPTPSPSSFSKTTLSGFVSKIDKGDIFSNKINENLNKKNQSNTNTYNTNDPFNHLAINTNSITHPYPNDNTSNTNTFKKSNLILDDSLFSKTPKANNNANHSIITENKPISKSTTNAEGPKKFYFGNNKNPQGIESPNQGTKSSVKSPNVPNNTHNPIQNAKVSQPVVQLIKAPSPIYYMSSLEKYHKTNIEETYFSKLYRDHFLQSFQALAYCKYLKPVDPKVLYQKKVMLNKRDTHKDFKTIVFDLDETLIHCNESLEVPYDVKLPIKFPSGEVLEAGISIRPYAVECLKELSQYFEIIVFTASHGCYANVVLDYLDPKKQYIHHRLFRDSCMQTEEGIYIKDLRIFANRNINDIVLVDNAAYSFGYQLENGIPIIPYYDNKSDQELKSLMTYLKFINNCKDIREINKNTFKFHLYSTYDTPDKVLDKLIGGTKY